MRVEVQEVTPDHWELEALKLAQRHGHATAQEMWDALDQGIYGDDTFVANQMRDLRDVVRLTRQQQTPGV